MTTMIERVARALYENDYKGRVWEWTDAELDENFPHIRKDCRRAARAAIEAMREPTEEMLDAFWNQTGESREMRSRVHSRARRYHEAMIDAAIKEQA